MPRGSTSTATAGSAGYQPQQLSFLASPSSSEPESAWPSTFQQIVSTPPAPGNRNDLLLSPMSSLSSPLVPGSGGKVVKPTFSVVRSDESPGSRKQFHYVVEQKGRFSTPITPSSTPASRKVYATPTSETRHYNSRGLQPSSAYVVTQTPKTEARRKLNMDNASSLVAGTVDPEGFKTPIKASKRRTDFSSPSPRKSKS